MFWSLCAHVLAEFDWLILTPEGLFLRLFQQYLLQQNSTNLMNINVNPTNVLCRVRVRVCVAVCKNMCVVYVSVCVCAVCVFV